MQRFGCLTLSALAVTPAAPRRTDAATLRARADAGERIAPAAGACSGTPASDADQAAEESVNRLLAHEGHCR
jgi:hypothetical protein